MVIRFHCLHARGMLEEEDGEYVRVEDYDKLKTGHDSFLVDVRRVLDELYGLYGHGRNQWPYDRSHVSDVVRVLDELYGLDCTVTDTINGLPTALTRPKEGI